MTAEGHQKSIKYRIKKIAEFHTLYQVQRKLLGIWWNVGPIDHLKDCESYVQDKLNPIVKEYN